jgi:hypothetical protein
MGLYVPKIGSHYFRIAQDLRRRTIGNTATKVEHGDMLGNFLDQVHVMIDEKNRQSVSLKTVQKSDELFFSTIFRPAPGSSRSSSLGHPARGSRDLNESLVPKGEALHCLPAVLRKTDEIEGS